MRVVLSAPAKFHFFDLAKELMRRDLLESVLTGYPLSKLRNEGVPANRLRSYPYFHLVYRALGTLGLELDYFDKAAFDWFTERGLPDCDVFMAMAGSALHTGRSAKRRGIKFLLDRPCSHIEVQDQLLRTEAEREGIRFAGIDPRVIARELQEYNEADLITVPSTFALRSFLEKGFDESRLRLVPYGVDLSRFHPVATPDPDRFEALFVGVASLRKGIPHLLRAFERIDHPHKRLTLAGNVHREVMPMIREVAERQSVRLTGHLPQPQLKEVMSRSHVLVLPSVEDGYGVVMSQAMACGSPVVATDHTGAAMLYDDGVEGFIVPYQDDDALTDRLQRLASNPELQRQMSQASLVRVQAIGGWTGYGDAIEKMLRELL